eukprot:GHVU01213699.1.p2 GENE.GHVU01213699.1~~GHVU01213699.1.p2  ORF type:complete len:105 (-),score=6.27 GHVU01213699.1:852-1166(-)
MISSYPRSPLHAACTSLSLISMMHTVCPPRDQGDASNLGSVLQAAAGGGEGKTPAGTGDQPPVAPPAVQSVPAETSNATTTSPAVGSRHCVQFNLVVGFGGLHG